MTRARRLSLFAGAAVALGAAGYGLAQIEGRDRGVPPIDSSANFEVGGVTVDVTGRTADQARTFGWRLAQRRGWKMLWARANGRPVAEAPGLSDGQLDGIVSGISVEDEQIGARRYIARLGVLFDRGRVADFLGQRGGGPRSAPTLVIPVLWEGGVPQSFERRTEWQRAWARFRSGGSPIDYIRPYGTGLDPLVLNVAQAGRPGRGWWRMLLDQYAASDVVVPTVTLQRRWPGGPVAAHFVAVHGPDGEVVAEFDLAAPSSDALPRMLDEGVRRLDLAYSQALRTGKPVGRRLAGGRAGGGDAHGRGAGGGGGCRHRRPDHAGRFRRRAGRGADAHPSGRDARCCRGRPGRSGGARRAGRQRRDDGEPCPGRHLAAARPICR